MNLYKNLSSSEISNNASTVFTDTDILVTFLHVIQYIATASIIYITRTAAVLSLCNQHKQKKLNKS